MSVRVAPGLALLLALAGCKSSPASSNVCKTDADCRAAGTRCSVEKQQCICVTDESCQEGQFCNSSGVCQVKAGCGVNSDCGKDTYCDISSGKCLAGPAQALGSACGLADHCPYETLCVEGTCQVGCFDDGDCLLGHICMNGRCASGAGLCTNDGFCDYRERCQGSQCQKDHRGPYCRGCSQRTATNPKPCDDPQNFCLINSQETTGHAEFCGVDCSIGQACPNGYECDPVVILTQSTCTLDAECRCDRAQIRFATATCTVAAVCDPKLPNGLPDPNASACRYVGQPDCNGGTTTGTASCIVTKGLRNGSCECTRDAQCPTNTKCVGGVCCGGAIKGPEVRCVGGESEVSGFCTCNIDDDCPHDSCDSSINACAITGRPCTPGNDDCKAISCVMGGCVIGSNCAPQTGLSCTIVGPPPGGN